MKKYKTIPIVIQYLKGGYGAVDMGYHDGDVLVLAIVPIIIFYAVLPESIL